MNDETRIENVVSDPYDSGGAGDSDLCDLCLVYHKQAGFHEYGFCQDGTESLTLEISSSGEAVFRI